MNARSSASFTSVSSTSSPRDGHHGDAIDDDDVARARGCGGSEARNPAGTCAASGTITSISAGPPLRDPQQSPPAHMPESAAPCPAARIAAIHSPFCETARGARRRRRRGTRGRSRPAGTHLRDPRRAHVELGARIAPCWRRGEDPGWFDVCSRPVSKRRYHPLAALDRFVSIPSTGMTRNATREDFPAVLALWDAGAQRARRDAGLDRGARAARRRARCSCTRRTGRSSAC